MKWQIIVDVIIYNGAEKESWASLHWRPLVSLEWQGGNKQEDEVETKELKIFLKFLHRAAL